MILWCAIVLIIAVVPLWRLRAMRQWAQPRVQLSYNSDVYGLTPALEAGAVRRFPDEAEAQSAPLQGLSWVGVRGGTKLDNPDMRRAEREYFARYDALELRFPQSNSVRAQRLLDAMRGSLDIDIGLQPKEQQMAPSIPKRERWLSQNALEAAVQSAQTGAQIEPDNAFFPWMEAVLNFSLKRDDRALDAFRRAANCARFDDYVTTRVRERLELTGRFHAVGWEDGGAEYGALLPHIAQMRNAARAALGRSELARRRGDTARALGIAGDVQSAGALIMRAKTWTVTATSGAAICSMVWQTSTAHLPNAPQINEFRDAKTRDAPTDTLADARTEAQSRIAWQKYQEAIVERFANYARQNNRLDLADAARGIAANAENNRSLIASDEPPALWTRLRTLASAYWAGAIVLRLALLGALIWLVLWPLAARDLEAPARRSVLLAAMFSLGASAVFLSTLAFAPSVVSLEPAQDFAIPVPPTDPFAFWIEYAFSVALVLWLVPMLAAASLRASPALNRAFKVGSLLMMWGVWAWGAGVATMNSYGPLVTVGNPAPSAREVNQLLAALAMGALVGGAFIVRWARASGLLRQTLTGALLWAGAAIFSIIAFDNRTPTFEIIIAYWMALALFALPFWLRGLNWSPARARLTLTIVGIAAGLWLIWVGTGRWNLPSFVALFLILAGATLAVVCVFRLLMRECADGKIAQFCFIIWGAANLFSSWAGRNFDLGISERLLNMALAALIVVMPLAGLWVGRAWWRGQIRFDARQKSFALPRLPAFAQLAARTRIAAGVLALLCALAYFGITLWTIPVEAQTRAMMARQLEIGEVAWLREQMKNARES